MAGKSGRIVDGWVFGEEVVEKGGFGGFWRFDRFGFGFAQVRRARFARFADSWGELEVKWDRKREEAAEGAENLAGELRGLGDQSDGFGLGEEMLDMVARDVEQIAGHAFAQPVFAGGDFDFCGFGGWGFGFRGLIPCPAWRARGWCFGGWYRGWAAQERIKAVQKAVKAGLDGEEESCFNARLVAHTEDGAFQGGDDRGQGLGGSESF